MSRITDWMERDSARTDAMLASRSTHWLIGRTLIGIFVTIKGIALTMHATHAWQYALAPLLFVGGIVFAFESAKIIVARVRGSQ